MFEACCVELLREACYKTEWYLEEGFVNIFSTSKQFSTTDLFHLGFYFVKIILSTSQAYVLQSLV